MDPLTIAAAIAGILGFVYKVGRDVYSFRTALSLASAEFDLFAKETDEFVMLWNLVEPYIQGPTPYVSNEKVEELGRLYSGAAEILNEFHGTIQTLQQEDKRFMDTRLQKASRGPRLAFAPSSWVPSSESRAGRLKQYFNRDQLALQRAQLQLVKNQVHIILSLIG